MSRLPYIGPAMPAILMAAETTTMIAPDAPDHVRYGGSCMLAIAMILADLQNGKKFGYTDKILKAVRKVPGMETADEGTLLGMLSLGGSVFLGGGEALSIAEGAPMWPGMLKIGYNVVSFPANTLFDFQKTRGTMEKWFGKELRFKYKNADGETKTTEPIDTQRLLQQVALISGAAGIETYGSSLGVWQIQFTGAMFLACNGLSIARIVKPAAQEVVAAQAAKLQRSMEAALMTGTLDENGFNWTPGEHMARFREQCEEFRGNLDLKPGVDTQDYKEIMRLAARGIAAASSSIAQAWTPPEKRGVKR